MKFFNQNPDDANKNVQNTNPGNNGPELEFNKKNRENYETLMTESSTKLDGYWDKNNPFVMLVLLILGVVIVVGLVYYVLAYLGTH